MAFTSFEYLFLFLPIVFILYWVVCWKSKNLQNALLLIASLFFYSLVDWRFVSLIAVTTISTYTISKYLYINRVHGGVIAAIVINIGILLYFKYFNFFIDSVKDLASVIGIPISVSTLNVILPIGISFYTFAALSYVFDVYSGKIKPTNDFLAFCTFITFFPSLLSGPISRATTQLPQYCEKRIFKYDTMSSAFKAIVWGIFMKVCIADRLGLYVNIVYSDIINHTGTSLFLAQLLYTLQIYADFAGYSLIAIGSGRLFGIELPNNFIRPYFSTTVTEFWRRWHISLTTWFRDYIYFPMGGSRVTKSRWVLNTMVVFVVSGLWHGAAYTFIMWGALHGVIMVVEKLIYGDRLKSISGSKPNVRNVLRLFVTFTIVSILWIFFRANDISDAFIIISKIFTNHGNLFVDQMTFICGFMSLAILLLKETLDEYNFTIHNTVIRRWCNYALYVFLISYILLFGVFDGGQFIYFQF